MAGKKFRALFLYSLLGAMAACSPEAPLESPAGTVAGSQSELLRWNEYHDDFVFPARRAWKNSGSASLSDHTPHHNGTDRLWKIGESAPLDGKFHYGDLRVDLKGEEIGLFARPSGAGEWGHIADGVTDNDGRVSFPFPATQLSQAGTYFVRMVVYGDLTWADSLVRILDAPAPAAVFDIDGTLTIAEWEIVKDVLYAFLDIQYLSRMRDDANKVARGLALAGYEIVYLTARPYWLTRETRAWLALKGFPLGTVHTFPGAIPPLGDATAAYKLDRLKAFQQSGLNFAYAFGNTKTDLQAYADAAIPKSGTHILGDLGGTEGTVALKAYKDLYGSLVPSPSYPYQVVLLVIDGLRPDALRTYLDTLAPEGSALKSLFGKSVEVRNCATAAPSVTFSGHAAIATGRSAASHGVVSNTFLDRETEELHGFTGGADPDEVIRIYRGEGAANQVLECPTLYEQMSSSGRYGTVVNHMYFRGGEFQAPSLTQLLVYLFDAGKFDHVIMDNALARLDGTDYPDLVTVYLPGLDHQSHLDGKMGGVALSPVDLTNSQLKYLKEVLDPEIERFRSKIEKLGKLPNTVFVICSDHGMRDVVKNDDHSIGLDYFGLENDEFDKVIEDSPYEDAWDTPYFEGDFDAHSGMDGGMLLLTLRNRATKSWKDAPQFAEDVLPVIGSIQQHRLSGVLVNAVEEILVRTDLTAPYQAVRPTRVKITFDSIQVVDDNDGSDSGEVSFDLRANGKILGAIGLTTANDGDTIPVNKSYEVDVMPGMALKVECQGEEEDWLSSDEMGLVQVPFPAKTSLTSIPYSGTSDTGDFILKFHVEVVPQSTYVYPELPGWGNLCPLTVLSPEYVMAPERITGMQYPNRSGDILLLPAFRDGYYFGNQHLGDHGSLYPEDSYQTFAIGGAPIAQSKIIVGGAGVDIAATVAHILGIDLRKKEGVSRVDVAALPQLPLVP